MWEFAASAGESSVDGEQRQESPTQREFLHDMPWPGRCPDAERAPFSRFNAAGFVPVYRQVRMPSSEAILNGLTAIANDWQQLALVWHAWLAALIVALLAGWRPSNRISGALLIAPVLSVGALAWVSGNPFNGAAFAILAVALAIIANRFTNERVRVASS